jgi:uncharacterized membrane protein YgdD (TMEM256/DUF423 family)
MDLKDGVMNVAWTRVWIAAGGLAGFGAVAMSAVTAHALPGRLDAHGLHAVESAVQMQGWHALALVLTGLMRASRLRNLAGGAFLLGMVLFCGSIYAGELGGIHIGPTAPMGGVLLMAGWLLLAAGAVFER